jgi:hypothetical protein
MDAVTLVSQLGVVLILILFSVYMSKMDRLERHLNRNHRLLQRIVEKLDIADPVDDEIINLVTQGNKILAIKRAKEEFDFSLKEAKDYVDELQKELHLKSKK